MPLVYVNRLLRGILQLEALAANRSAARYRMLYRLARVPLRPCRNQITPILRPQGERGVYPFACRLVRVGVILLIASIIRKQHPVVPVASCVLGSLLTTMPSQIPHQQLRLAFVNHNRARKAAPAINGLLFGRR